MIRAATTADASACSEILFAWIKENSWYPSPAPESASESAMLNRISSSTVLVVDEGEGISGFIAHKDGYLDCLYLRPEARNRGMGKTLLNEAKAASPEGLGLWVLEQNIDAQRFYIHEGFLETARGDGSDNEENLPDIRFEWHPEEAHNG